MSVPADLQRFAERAPAHFSRDGGGPVVIARAPGRLDVMGGIADYSGALVLQWPIRESTRVAVQRRDGGTIRITSVSATGRRQADVSVDLLANARAPYDNLRAWFAARPDEHWAAYVAGVFAVLSAEHHLRLDSGADVLVESDVPEGKGVSSSAAIEAATMEAVVAAWDVDVDAKSRAISCQRVENLVVGAPCGVMDQMAAVCGEAGALMALLCQPAEFQGTVHLPDDLAVWGVDSGIRHAVTGADYGGVRVGAFMGYRVLADLAGLTVHPGQRPGHVRVDDPRWHGYLANVGEEAFAEYEARIPTAMAGATFLSRFGGTTDLVTDVEVDRTYAVRTPAAHPVYEHERVVEWARLLRAGAPNDADRARLGELMFESHASYSACGLGSSGTDAIVELVRAAGPADGLWGAKITGGGSGGTVAILGRSDAGPRVARIAAEYEAATGRRAHVFEGSSPGAAAVGTVRLAAAG